MTDDLRREAVTMVKRNGGAHQCSMPHEQFDLIHGELTRQYLRALKEWHRQHAALRLKAGGVLSAKRFGIRDS
jgi:hypothetical protein